MSRTSSQTMRAALLAFISAVLVFAFHFGATQDNLLFDDAADYARAAQPSLSATWLNRGAQAPAQILHRYRNDVAFHAHPWDSLYSESDPTALRHFHGPVSFYLMHLAGISAHPSQTQRALSSVAASLICCSMVIVLYRLGTPLLLSFALSLYAGLGSRFVEVSVDPTPHVWYILFSLLFLYFFAQYLTCRSTSALYAAAVTLGINVATLEFSVQLFATIVASVLLLAFLNRFPKGMWREEKAFLLRAFLLFLFTTCLVWPGGWIRGGYAINYGVLSATVLLKNKAAFGEHLSLGLIYRAVFAHHIVFVALTLFTVAAAVAAALRRRLSTATIVFCMYTLTAFALGVADHFKLNTYISEFVIFLVALAGLLARDVLSTLPSRTARGWLVTACVALLACGCITEFQKRNEAWQTRPWLQAVFAGVRGEVPTGSILLASSDREALSLYLPEYRFEPTVNAQTAQPRSPERTASAGFAVLGDSIPPPAGAVQLANFPAGAGRSYVLWKLR